MSEPNKQPNFVVITFDDLQWQSFGYLNKSSIKYTPNLTEFAKEGRIFLHSHVPYALCTVTRASLMTGMTPLRHGVTGHQIPVLSGVKTLPGILQSKGYTTALMGKNRHTIPFRHDEFDYLIGPDQLSMGRSPEKFYEHVYEFSSNNKNKPLFININIHDPHTPYPGTDSRDNLKSYLQFITDRTGLASLLDSDRLTYQGTTPGDPVRYQPEDVEAYPFLPDVPLVRKEMTQILTGVERADRAFYMIIMALKDAGVYENTIIFVLSDHGAALPFSKQNVYLNSTRMGLLVRSPYLDIAGTVDRKNLVSVIDIYPTIIEMIGGVPTFNIEGKSILPLLNRGSNEDVIGWRNTLTIYHQGENPMRSITSARMGYIFNSWSDGTKEGVGHWRSSASFKAMRQNGQKNSEIASRLRMLIKRSPEELYDYQEDENALHNLVDEVSYKEKLNEMRRSLLKDMKNKLDPLYDDYCDFLAQKPELPYDIRRQCPVYSSQQAFGN